MQGLADGEAVLFCHCRHLLHIVGEEAGEDEGALGGEVLDVGGQVGGEDVLVDVGDDGLELAFDGRCVAEDDGHIIYIIKGEVLAGILHAEFVDVDTDTTLTTSISLICSPPFAPVMGSALGNKAVIGPGIAVGLFGYAIGT